MTVLLACASPADSNIEETLSTLRFAARALAVVNEVEVRDNKTQLKEHFICKTRGCR
jgi:hypothetical protein